MLTVIKAGVLL